MTRTRSRRGTCAAMIRRVTLASLIGLVAIGFTGCGNSGFAPGDVAGRPQGQTTTCAFSVSYHDTGYIGTYPPVPFEIGERIGTATIPPCNDTGQDHEGPVDTVAVYRIEGLDPSDALAVRSGPDDELQLVAAFTGSGPSPAVDAYIAERNPNGSILVTPDRNLHDGDTVTVTIRGLDPGTEAMLAQCASVQGAFACVTRSIGPVPPASSTSSSSSSTSTSTAPSTDTGRAQAPTTAIPGPNTVVEVPLQLHEPLRGHLELFDSQGNRVTDRKAPGHVACHGIGGLSCLVAVRGTHNRQRVVRYATIGFATGESPPSTPD